MPHTHENIPDLLDRYLHGLYTREEAECLFRHWPTDTGPRQTSGQMDELWEECQQRTAAPERYESYRKEARHLLNRMNKKENHRRLFFSCLKYASVAVLLLTLTYSLFRYAGSGTQPAVYYTEVRVENGERKELRLPDQTKVVLNAGSYIRYPARFDGRTRLVEIDGEAFFEVKRNETKPFIVRTGAADVKVLGTSFDVKAYAADEQVCVSVRSGKVQVDMPQASMRLVPDEQLVIDKEKGEFQKRNEDVGRVTAWMQGGLYFNKTPIRSVARELERRYNCTIEFASSGPYEEYIYGEHDNKSLESVLKSIRHSTRIDYRKENGKIILYKK